jgi:hypothetical protein
MDRSRLLRAAREDEASFDWQRAARERGVPVEEATRAFDGAQARAGDAGSHQVEALYLDELDALAALPPLEPGKRTLTMRRAAELGLWPGQRRPDEPPVAPGRRTRSSRLSPAEQAVGWPRLPSEDEPPFAPGRRTWTARLAGRMERAFDDVEVGVEANARVQLRARTRRDPRAVLDSLSSSGEPMQPEHRARFERAFGRDLSHVVVHADGDAASAAADLSAHAFAVGPHLYFGAGEYAPGTEAGDRLLAHELTHVVQHDDGRLPQHGLSSPTDPAEQEAYANEARIVGALADAAPGLPAPAPAADTSRYRGAPSAPIQRDAAAPPERRRPTATEAQLMGPMPRPPAPAPVPAPPPPARAPQPPPAATAAAATATAPRPAAAPTGQPQPTPTAPTVVRPPSAAPLATSTTTPSPAPTLGGDATAWAAEARATGARRSAELAAAAAAAQARIQAAAPSSRADAAARFAAARAALAAAATAATAAITARAAGARAAIQAQIASSRAAVDDGFTARLDAARADTAAARAAIEAIAEAEATRAVDGSTARADRARAIADADGGGGEAPLAQGRRDIARRGSDEARQQCERAGRETAAEVRRAAQRRADGLDGYLADFEAALERARTEARAALDTLAGEAGASLDAETTRALADVAAHRDSGTAYLDGKEAEHAAWTAGEAAGTGDTITGDSAAQAAEVAAAYETLATRYDQAAAEIAAELGAPAEGVDRDGLAEAQQQIAVELARVWTEGTGAIEPRVTAAIDSYRAQADEIERGHAGAVTALGAELRTATDGATADLTSSSTRFDAVAGELEARASRAASAGVAETLRNADAAEARRAADTAAHVEDTRGQLSGAVDQQLTQLDAEVTASQQRVADGQAQAGAEYATVRSQAEARNAGGAAAAILRGWLGDLWDFFDDLADSVLEWMQEQLGEVWGTIIGGLCWLIIEAVNVIVCAVAWVGAQLVNLIWGFLWGETAIPGYGGGFFAFVADVIAGVLVYGDVRDIIKYWIVYPLMGEGPWWLNLLLGALAVVGLVPLLGDGLKAILKGVRALTKTTMRRLIRELGEEVAQKLVREVGEDVATDLLDRLGAEALQRLAGDMTGDAIRHLIDDFGELTVRRLSETLAGPAIRAIGDDVGAEGLEKLARTLGGDVIQELHTALGGDVLRSLLDGLRGSTIKEYLDRLGADTLSRLGRDLDGYAVKELVDDLGDEALQRLASDLTGASIQHLYEELGARALRALSTRLDGPVIERLVADLGGAEVRRLMAALGDDTFAALVGQFDGPALKAIVDELTAPVVKELADGLTAPVFKELIDTFTTTGVKELTDRLTATTVRELVTGMGVTGLKQACDALTRPVVCDLVLELGAASFKSAWDEIGEAGLRALTADLAAPAIKALYTDLGGAALRNLTSGLSGNQIFDLARNHGLDLPYLRALGEVAGSGSALARALTHFGGAGDLAQILAKAHTSTMSAAVLRELLDLCPGLGCRKIPEILSFFDRVVGHGASDSAFRLAMRATRHFAVDSVGNLVPHAGRNVPDLAAAVQKVFTLADGSTVTLTFGAADILHIASRHTFEFFAMIPSNAAVKAQNSMFAPGTTRATIAQWGQDIMNSADLQALMRTLNPGDKVLEQPLLAGHPFLANIDLSAADGLVSFFGSPSMANVLDVPKDLMKAAIWLWKSI